MEVLDVKLQDTAMPFGSVDLHGDMMETIVRWGLKGRWEGVRTPFAPVHATVMNPSDDTLQRHDKRTDLSREEVMAARKLRKENKKKRKRSEDEASDRPLPEGHHCSYWMAKKRRYCNLSRHQGTNPHCNPFSRHIRPVASCPTSDTCFVSCCTDVPGALYCTDHLSNVDGQKRIPCPIDSRQYVI